MLWTDQDDVGTMHEQDQAADRHRMRVVVYVTLAIALAFVTSCGVAVGLRVLS